MMNPYRQAARTLRIAAMVPIALAAALPAGAADSAALNRDLGASIALLGLPCGQVVAATALGERDYLATCSDGNRYRVYVNAQGRVTAEKR